MFTVSDLDSDVLDNLVNGFLKSDPIPFSNPLNINSSGLGDTLFSFSPSWIGRAEEAKQEDLLSRFFDASSQDEKVSIAGDLVKSMLREAASTLKDSGLRDRYLSSEISERELVGVLEYCDTPTLLNFTKKICELSDGSKEVGDFVRSKLDNVFRVSTEGEKASILNMLISSEVPSKGSFVAEGLRSAESHGELSKLIKVIGEGKLSALGNLEVSNMVAQGVFGETLRRLSLPKAPKKDADEASQRKFFKDLDSVLERAEKSLTSKSELASTDNGKEYLVSIAYFRGEATNSDGVNCEALNARISLSFRYGLRLTDTSPGTFGSGARWSVDELKDVEKALKRLPEGIIISTPVFCELQRVESIGPGILGARYSDGVIRIADLAIKHPAVEKDFPGIGSLQMVLVHEIGHGIQLGRSYGRIYPSPEGSPTIEGGDDRMDFDEFLGVSGWQVIDRDRWEVTTEGKLLIDGEEYKIRTPIELDGQRLILTFSRGELFAINAEARFSFDDYARTNPWEDYAEAFSEYFLMPKRLFQYAPDKYRFFEEEFGMHGKEPR